MNHAVRTRLFTVAVTGSALVALTGAAFATATPAAPVGPDANGPARFGLCTAYAASATAHPTNLDAVAFDNLLAAADAAGQSVTDFCSGDTGVDPLDVDDISTTTTVVGDAGDL